MRGFVCVKTLLSELCGELPLTHEDPGPPNFCLWKPPCHLDHIGLKWGAEQNPVCLTHADQEDAGMKVHCGVCFALSVSGADTQTCMT